jgi:hypothetical protein
VSRSRITIHVLWISLLLSIYPRMRKKGREGGITHFKRIRGLRSFNRGNPTRLSFASLLLSGVMGCPKAADSTRISCSLDKCQTRGLRDLHLEQITTARLKGRCMSQLRDHRKHLRRVSIPVAHLVERLWTRAVCPDRDDRIEFRSKQAVAAGLGRARSGVRQISALAV